ncbi:DUF4112 domain-containing protein [Planctomicrobium piriforme]|uniref:DUF4112 domain-containing protein n=1 Tax=Planctomicrobium piriforme TaxID=1576369 RepID=A0A1I3L4P0_9PLAN|nr:DUF4112 domain-containing protein [Planctomicrobium piriforme]SFI79639.1 protein of unknown function [Planctomicrobium piriforme]
MQLMTVSNSFESTVGSSAKREKRVLTPAEELEILRRVQMLSNLLDNQFAIPGTSIRVGWDAVIGLIPGIGDIATTCLAGYLVYLARELNVPKPFLMRMIFNVAVDFGAGVVPVVGDVLDVAWKANLKNVKLLERHLQQRHAG